MSDLKCQSPTGFGKVLLAPLLALAAPGRAAQWLIGAPRLALLAAYLLWLTGLVAAGTVVVLRQVALAYAIESGEARRSFLFAWRELDQYAAFGPVEIGIAAAALGLMLGHAFLAWLALPRVHRIGPIWSSFGLSWRAQVGSAGLLLLFAVAIDIGVTFVLFVLVPNAPPFLRREVFGAVAAGLSLITVFGLLASMTMALARGARRPEPPVHLPPVCEECGYDLSVQPADGRCPECGYSVAASLTFGFRRVADEWESGQARNVLSWLCSTRELWLRPTRFYKRLALRGPLAAGGAFAFWHYVAIALGSMIWITIMWVLEEHAWRNPRPDFTVLVVLLLFMPLATPLVCWFVRRVIAALAFTLWPARTPLADGGWVEKIIAYETAVIGWLCVGWGSVFLAMALFPSLFRDPGLQRVMRRMLFMETEPAAILFVLASFGLISLWRYGFAHRAVRWSNF